MKALQLDRCYRGLKELFYRTSCPEIPHDAINVYLKNLGIRFEANTTFIRTRVTESIATHTCSFRRQTYIHPDDVEKIPDSVLINYDSFSTKIHM